MLKTHSHLSNFQFQFSTISLFIHHSTPNIHNFSVSLRALCVSVVFLCVTYCALMCLFVEKNPTLNPVQNLTYFKLLLHARKE